MNLLVAGLIGAAVAVVGAGFYSYYMYQTSRRADLALDVVSWIDDIYDRLITIHAQREATFTGAAFGLSNDEYRQVVKETKAMLLASKMHAKVSLIYGDGRELDKFDTLKEEFVSIAELLLEADKETWDQTNKQINYKLSKIIEPLMNSTERNFLIGSRAKAIASDFMKKNMPTLYLASNDENKSIVVRPAHGAPTLGVGKFVRDEAAKFWEAFLYMLRALAILAVIGLITWNCYGRPDMNKVINKAISSAASQAAAETRYELFTPPLDYGLMFQREENIRSYR